MFLGVKKRINPTFQTFFCVTNESGPDVGQSRRGPMTMMPVEKALQRARKQETSDARRFHNELLLSQFFFLSFSSLFLSFITVSLYLTILFFFLFFFLSFWWRDACLGRLSFPQRSMATTGNDFFHQSIKPTITNNIQIFRFNSTDIDSD